MGRRCPICGRGMFRYRQLIRHMVKCHPHCTQYPVIAQYQLSYQSGHQIRVHTKRRETQKKQKAVKK